MTNTNYKNTLKAIAADKGIKMTAKQLKSAVNAKEKADYDASQRCRICKQYGKNRVTKVQLHKDWCEGFCIRKGITGVHEKSNACPVSHEVAQELMKIVEFEKNIFWDVKMTTEQQEQYETDKEQRQAMVEAAGVTWAKWGEFQKWVEENNK